MTIFMFEKLITKGRRELEMGPHAARGLPVLPVRPKENKYQLCHFELLFKFLPFVNLFFVKRPSQKFANIFFLAGF